jgi:hypothetical protein
MFADVSGALGACMRAVWKRNDRPWPKPEGVEPSATIDDLAELSAVIRSWGLRKPTARLPIQRSAWKGNSAKSVCKILHSPGRMGSESPESPGPHRSLNTTWCGTA